MANRRNEIFRGGGHEQTVTASRDVMREDFGIEVPVETVPIPSQGKVYPPGSPLHCKETVDIKAMTAREEDILTSPALIKKGTVITELIRSCLIDRAVDVDDMLAGDRNALMVAIRITGYGREYESDIRCTHCSEKTDVTFDLASLAIKRLTIEPSETGQNLFEFVLPQSKVPVKFRFLTGRDETNLTQEREQSRKTLKMDTDSGVTSRLLRSVVSVRDVTDRAKLAHFVRSMPAVDSRALRAYIEENEPGIDMAAYVTCRLCGEGQSVSMPIGVKFFWPDS